MGLDRDQQLEYEFQHPGTARAPSVGEAGEDRLRAVYCQPCKEKGRKQMAHRVLPGRRGICKWCYRGEPHPEEQKSKVKAGGDGAGRTSAVQAGASGPTPDPRSTNSKEAVMPEQKVCGEPGCGKKLQDRNGSGYCGKHFYRSKQGSPVRKKRGRPAGTVTNRGAERVSLQGANGAVAMVALPEAKLDAWWQSLSVGRKGEILAAAFFGQA